MSLDELLPDDAIFDFHEYVDAYDDGLPTGVKRRHESHITGKDLKAALREEMSKMVKGHYHYDQKVFISRESNAKS